MAEAPSTPQQSEELDPLAQALGPSKVESFLEDNKLLIAVGFGALIVVALGIIIYGSNREAAQTEAAHAFTAANSVNELDKVAERFSGSVVGGNALLRKAAVLEDDGKPDEARTTLIEFRDRHPNHPRLSQGLLILARMSEDEGELGKARDYYQQAATDPGLAPFARMHLGDLALQEGNLEEARDLYVEIEREYSENPWSSLLQDRLAKVNQQLNKAEWPDVVLEKPLPEPKPAEESEPAEESAPAEASESESSEDADPEAPEDSNAEETPAESESTDANQPEADPDPSS